MKFIFRIRCLLRITLTTQINCFLYTFEYLRKLCALDACVTALHMNELNTIFALENLHRLTCQPGLSTCECFATDDNLQEQIPQVFLFNCDQKVVN